MPRRLKTILKQHMFMQTRQCNCEGLHMDIPFFALGVVLIHPTVFDLLSFGQ